jgi:hypothetical protein
MAGKPGACSRDSPRPLTADGNSVTAAAFDEGGSLAVGVWDATNEQSDLYIYQGAGAWSATTASYPSKTVTRIVAVRDNGGSDHFVAALSDNTGGGAHDVAEYSGAAWGSVVQASLPAPRAILGLAGADGTVGGSTYTLYVVVNSTPGNGVNTAIFAYDGATWTPVNAPANTTAGELTMSPLNPSVVYVSGYDTTSDSPYVWRSNNGGTSWTLIYNVDPAAGAVTVNPEGWNEIELGTGFGGAALGLTTDRPTGQTLLFTNLGVQLTGSGNPSAGGVTWKQSYTEQYVSGSTTAWTSVGLEVTTTWDYCSSASFDFILYTDIGLAKSGDGGFSWAYAGNVGGTEWGNWYQMILAGTNLFAAVSELHDPPYDEGQWGNPPPDGTVLMSTDGGNTFSDVGGGWGLPVTSVAYGTINGIAGLSLVAAAWNKVTGGAGGIYHSEDLGATWAGPLPGLSAAYPPRAYRVVIDPATNDLYCVVSLPGGGVYQWNGSSSFTALGNLNGQATFYPADLTIRRTPGGTTELYLGAFGVAGGALAQPLKYDAGSNSWNALNVPMSPAFAEYPDFFGVYFVDPLAYATTSHSGTWAAPVDQLDGIAAPTPTWTDTGWPFLRTHRVTQLQNSTDGSLYVSSFGYGMMRIAPELLSYYFAIFSRLQVLDVPQANMTTGQEPFAALNGTSLWIGTTTANTPLYMVLRQTDLGSTAPFQYPPASGPMWAPLAQSPAWTALASGGALTDAVATWLPEYVTNGQNPAIPAAQTPPAPIANPDTSDQPVCFVCSDATDDGTRPGSVPSNFWATSLIELTNPTNGAVVHAFRAHGDGGVVARGGDRQSLAGQRRAMDHE